MKLDRPSMFAFGHSGGGFGMPDTPTSDEGTYVGPISLHNTIEGVGKVLVGRRNRPLRGCRGAFRRSFCRFGSSVVALGRLHRPFSDTLLVLHCCPGFTTYSEDREV
jgi:hypothetical protein